VSHSGCDAVAMVAVHKAFAKADGHSLVGTALMRRKGSTCATAASKGLMHDR
jgi:hypothetical protein